MNDYIWNIVVFAEALVGVLWTQEERSYLEVLIKINGVLYAAEFPFNLRR